MPCISLRYAGGEIYADIAKKIQTALFSRFDSEADVVYILVEMRKLMELEPRLKEKYREIRLFSDWAVHTTLSGSEAKRLLRFVDKLLSERELTGQISEEARVNLDSWFGLRALRTNLIEFCNEVGVQPGLLLAYPEWLAYSERCRSAFRTDADHDSNLMPITIPK